MEIIRAAAFAARCHKGQIRKFTDRPFIEHPMRVAGRVTLLPDVSPIQVAAAWVHHAIEDCKVPKSTLVEVVGEPVADLVDALSNPSRQFPRMSRPQRKQMDNEHLSQQSRWVKILKLVDRIDTVRISVKGDNPGWQEIFIRECQDLADCLYVAGDDLVASLVDELRNEVGLLHGLARAA